LPFPAFFLAFPKNAQKNNAREVAKISLAFSLAFILQIQQKIFNFFILSDFIRPYAKSPRHPV
jgi:hypothetical protein